MKSDMITILGQSLQRQDSLVGELLIDAQVGLACLTLHIRASHKISNH